MKVKSGSVISHITKRERYAEHICLESDSACDFVQVEGLDSMLEVDGGVLIAKPSGRIRFHGADWSQPRMMLRVSRDAQSNSINQSCLESLWFSGHSQMQFVNDGSEMSSVKNCLFENYADNGSNIVYTNKDRSVLGDAVRRDKATNSGHLFVGNTFACWGAQTKVNRDRAACLRFVGETTDVWVRNCWFSGKAPAMVLVDEPDEAWTNASGSSGGRVNHPRRIVIEDCVIESESAKDIQCYGLPSLNMLDLGYCKRWVDSNGNLYIEIRGGAPFRVIQN